MYRRAATTATTATRRSFATVARGSFSPATTPYIVFDRPAKRIQRDRAALAQDGESSRTVDYVRAEVAERLIERFMVRANSCHKCISALIPVVSVIQDVRRKFDTILDLGSGSGHFTKLLEPALTNKVIMLDSSGTCCFQILHQCDARAACPKNTP